ncbi:zn2-c6 fungal-type dna-binding domain [Trichoderma arundinaceum]|uniref:Zn2-c6 fungal-type dna-binding domain n=1 Tax=Trichoderma arundinaceum TaxID=490622 RepID=A0A395NY19_TRIAR|nr:zn2-c6 fungal-type dna-binding domain [Trichoderma arundinaceum]
MAPVRGRAACDGCRSRKQKCDEKSGPAKGYIEALEHRLAVTEAVLLQLLEVSDDAVLQDAFKHEPSKRTDVLNMAAAATTTTDAAGRIEAKKTGTIAHWDNFPLNTADEVKRWAGEVLGRNTDDIAMNGTAHEEADPRPFKTYPLPPDPLPNSLTEASSRASAEAFPPRPMEPSATALPTAAEPVLAAGTNFGRDVVAGEVFDLSQDFRRQFVW